MCTYVQPESEKNGNFVIQTVLCKKKKKIANWDECLLESWKNDDSSSCLYIKCVVCVSQLSLMLIIEHLVTVSPNCSFFANLQNNLFFIWKCPAQLSVFIWHENKRFTSTVNMIYLTSYELIAVRILMSYVLILLWISTCIKISVFWYTFLINIFDNLTFPGF